MFVVMFSFVDAAPLEAKTLEGAITEGKLRGFSFRVVRGQEVQAVWCPLNGLTVIKEPQS